MTVLPALWMATSDPAGRDDQPAPATAGRGGAGSPAAPTDACAPRPDRVDTGRTVSPAEARLLLTQLLSPAFPVGSYAYSQGLEVAMAEGSVQDTASLGDWVKGVLLHGSARIDLHLLAQARRPGADWPALAALARAYAPCRERSDEQRDQGAALAACARALGLATPDLPYPVALGAATAALPLETPEVASLYLQALAAQLISAAVRFVPLSAVEGQRLLASLVPILARLAEGQGALTSAHLAADLAAMAHETLQPRIFRS